VFIFFLITLIRSGSALLTGNMMDTAPGVIGYIQIPGLVLAKGGDAKGGGFEQSANPGTIEALQSTDLSGTNISISRVFPHRDWWPGCCM
jgi:hypothetical protein